MRGDNFQNLYNIWEHDSYFDHNRKLELVHNHHHHEGSSDNGGIFSGFDQTENHQTAANNLNLQLHPHPHPQGGSPIGLTLKKSNSLINLVEMTLSNDREQKKPTRVKLKASNFPALLLQIGSWKLNQPPQFGREINPRPRKHTQWKETTDFTGGQASVCRRHSVIFPPGVLDKPYEKLLQCDNRLFSLNQHHFPVNNYPFFYNDPNHSLDYFSRNIHHRSPAQSHGGPDFNLTSVMALPYSIEGARMHTNKNQERGNNHCGGIPTTHIGVQDHLLPCYGQESWIVQQSQTKMINEDIDFSGHENGGIVNSEIAILEPDLWVGVPNIYGLPWESRTEDIWSINI